MQMNAIMAETAGWLFSEVLPAVTPIIPTMYCETTIKLPPVSKILRRPNLSISQNDTGVEQTLQSVVIRTMRNGVADGTERLEEDDAYQIR